MNKQRPSLAVIGGTGNLGYALAGRWARAGYGIIIGSRSADKAARAADELQAADDGTSVEGRSNADAVRAADVVVLTVPFSAQGATLADIAGAVNGKLVVDTTVPLAPPKVARVQLPDTGSAALAARKALGDDARLVSAFHNVAAHKLKQGGHVDCDILIFGDDPADRDIVVELARSAGMRGIHCGPLANSVAAEALTSILIGINKRYKADGAGIRITGIADT